MEVNTAAIDRAIEVRRGEIAALETARNIIAANGAAREPEPRRKGIRIAHKPVEELKRKASGNGGGGDLVVRGAGARILAEIARGPATNGELLRKLDLSSPGVTYQTAKLCGIRFIEQQGSKYAILPAGRAWLDSNEKGA